MVSSENGFVPRYTFFFHRFFFIIFTVYDFLLCKNLAKNERIAGWISIRTIDRELRAWSGNFSCELRGYVSAGGKVREIGLRAWGWVNPLWGHSNFAVAQWHCSYFLRSVIQCLPQLIETSLRCFKILSRYSRRNYTDMQFYSAIKITMISIKLVQNIDKFHEKK